jgi:hypothetical protein
MEEQEGNFMTLDVSVARFAPMRRLLSSEDEDYLIRQGFHREASWIRAHHRKYFFRFVDMLEKDFDTAHAARKAAMAGNWDFETLLKERLAASYYLFAMRTAGVMHVAHMPQAARLAVAYFERVQPLIGATQLESVPSF